MTQQNKIVRTYGLWFLDMATILASYLIVTYLRFAEYRDYGDRTQHYLVGVLFLLFCTIYTFFLDWNRDILTRGYLKEIFEIGKFMILMLLVVLAAAYFLRWADQLSRFVVGNFVWICALLMFVVHLLFKRVMRSVITSEKLVVRLLVVSARERMDRVVASLENLTDEGYRVVATRFLDEENLTEEMVTVPFDEVFIDAPDLPQERVRRMIEGFEEMGVVCHYNLSLPDAGDASTKVASLGDYTVVSYTMFKSSYKRLLIKRVVDILGGLIGSLITIVLAVFIIPAIKLESRGPAFFRQTRVGKNGRRFTIYKFRSMYADAEARLKDLQGQNEVSGPMFKLRDDPRVTGVGRFLRKTSLDEFPQFFNILKGDMSLVGTRPPTEEEFERYNEHYRRRISMTPGLTGLWQVSGRSDIEDFDEVVRLDLKYIDNWSLMLDFKILFQTIGVVLKGSGAR